MGPSTGAVEFRSGADGHLLARYDGETPQAELGNALTLVGDLDGDGLPELAVGAWRASLQGPQRGAVLLLHLRGDSPGASLAWRSIPGEEDRAALGSALAAPGDLDGDGTPDLLVGAPDAGQEPPRGGALRAYSGQDLHLLYEIRGETPRGRLGSAIAPLGDLDGDGTGDYLVGVPGAGGGRGEVQIRSGADGHLLRRVAGELRGAAFGSALQAMGDANGDGAPDFAVGAPHAAAAGPDSGRVTVHSGTDGKVFASWDGPEDGALLGSALALLPGPQEGSGLLVGAPGSGRAGAVFLFSPKGEAPLRSYVGVDGGGAFGSALAAGPGFFLCAAPRGGRGAPRSGMVRGYGQKGLPPPAAVASAESTPTDTPKATSATAPPESNGILHMESDFLAEESLAADWKVAHDSLGRWVLYSTMDSGRTQKAVEAIERGYQVLDDALGGPGLEGDLAFPEPVTLVFLDDSSQQSALCDLLAKRWPHLRSWAQASKAVPSMLLWDPFLGVVRHDGATSLVKRPEIQLLHFAVHLELVRRYGALPGWLPEALSYGVQDELMGEIYGYSNRGWEKLSDTYNQEWRERTAALLRKRVPELRSLLGDRNQAFEQDRAYGRFALGLWLLDGAAPGKLDSLLRAYAEARPAKETREQNWVPKAALQTQLFARALGGDPMAKVATFWEGVSLEGGPRARHAARIASIESWIGAQRKLRSYENKGHDLRLISDFGARDARRILKAAEAEIGRLERAIGPIPTDPAGEDSPSLPPPLTAIFLRDAGRYTDLCATIARSSPGLASYMATSARTTGFLLPRLPYTAGIQTSAPAVNYVIHNLVHLWLRRRVGELPLWLSEGLACAAEEGQTGMVSANWYLDGFVYDASRTAWRKTAQDYVTTSKKTILCYDWTGLGRNTEPPMVRKPKPDLAALFAYPATTYRDDLAHYAYAFAVWGRDGVPEGLRRFVGLLQREYQERWPGGGRFLPSPERTRDLAVQAFGEDFERDFVDWWRKGPKRGKR